MERAEQTEKYVTIEQAQALKRLGFDWECDHYYVIGGAYDWHLLRTEGGIPADFNKNVGECPIDCSAPALHIAAKWLRDVKGLAVSVLAYNSGMYDWETVFLPNAEEAEEIIGRSPWCDTYESALSEGITAALNHLNENQKEN